MRTRLGQIAAVTALGALVLASPGVAHADDTMLDTSFSSDGRVTTDIGPGDDSAGAVVTTPNLIGAVGSTTPSSTSLLRDFAIAVYDSAGNLDTAFGNGGIVTTDFGGDDIASAAMIQGQKLVVAGTTTTSNGSDFALARYTSTGALDTTFGNGGKVVTDVAGDSDGAHALLAQGDKIVAGGFTLSGGIIDFALVRYNANGKPDYTFGNNGRVTTDFAGDVDQINGLVAGPNGTIVAAGQATVGDSSDFALARYDSMGNLDPGFGTGGKVTTSFSGFDDVGRAIKHEGSKLVVAGFTFTSANKQDFALARYTADGHLDTTFAGTGKVITDFDHDNDRAFALVVQPSAITAVGSTVLASKEYFGLARYDTSGHLVRSWGVQGRTATGFGGTGARALGAAAQGDKVVAAGQTGSTGGLTFAVSRYRAS
jgi:uncharacterized delta-60 repeat protein